jgi:DNA-binding NtrC family response regulator
MQNIGQKILLVDDARDTLEILQRNLESAGYQVFSAACVEDGIKILESTDVHLVITDYKMPKISGLDLIKHVRENFKDTEVMMITGYATIEGAVNAFKTGAEEYLSKPFTDEELFSAVKRALDKQKEKESENRWKKAAASPYGIIGESSAMKKVARAISKAASTNATVLITGESGTGKELVARAIHYSSPCASSPFIPVNCGGIPEGLIESELFGHVKGAYTGATESRAGFFQTADGGSIFLDEISETSLSMQVKLLRVIEDKQVYMVGADRAQKVHVRILTATNKDLQGLVKKGAFREDLFFRLNVITIEIPPLREREDDILILAHYFADKYANELGKPKPEFSENASRALQKYYWLGNVRELENVVQRLVVMTDKDVIDIHEFPSLMRFSALRSTGFNKNLAEMEAEYIQNVLSSVHGNKTRAAEILNIDRKTLREKLKNYRARFFTAGKKPESFSPAGKNSSPE